MRISDWSSDVCSSDLGLAVYNSSIAPLILPAAVLILLGLFWIQGLGTNRVASLFGPIMLFYFLTIAVLGIISIVKTPGILHAFNPYWAVMFFVTDPLPAFLALGAVVLAVTRSEERRVGNECGSKCRSGWSPYH